MKKLSVLLAALVALLLFTAVAIAGQNGSLRPRHLRGEIVSLDSTASTASFLCLDDVTRTVSVDASTTTIIKNGRRVSFANLALGDHGTAKYRRTDDGLKALKIIVKTPLMRGKISAITFDTITIKRPKSTFSRTFNVDADTKIRRNGALAALSGLKIGDQAKVLYNKLESGGFIARRIKAAGNND